MMFAVFIPKHGLCDYVVWMSTVIHHKIENAQMKRMNNHEIDIS